MNWPAYQSARWAAPRNIQKFITKLQIRWLPTNGQLNVLHGTSPECCFCGQPESSKHVYKCQANQEWKKSFRRSLALHLDNRTTDLSVTNTILQGIDHLLTNDSISRHDKCQHKESGLTWTDFIQGRLDLHWEQQMDLNYRL